MYENIFLYEQIKQTSRMMKLKNQIYIFFFRGTYVSLTKRVTYSPESFGRNGYDHVYRHGNNNTFERMPDVRKGHFEPYWVCR